MLAVNQAWEILSIPKLAGGMTRHAEGTNGVGARVGAG